MTTATKPRTTPLAQLEKLERSEQKAAETARALAREHFEKQKRLHGHLDTPGLLDERRRLQHRDPAQYKPDGAPSRKDSAAGRIEAEITSIGDLSGLAAQVEHARRVEERAKQDRLAYIASDFPAIVEALRPQAEAAASEVSEVGRAFTESLNRYLAAHARAVGLTVAVQGIDGRAVPGLDQVADLKRQTENVNLPAPLPELP